MKRTLDISDDVIVLLEKAAVARGETMSSLVETAVRRHLGETVTPATRALAQLPSFDGGLPRASVHSRDVLYGLMEED